MIGMDNSGICGSNNVVLFQRLCTNVHGISHNEAENNDVSFCSVITSAVFQALAVPVPSSA